MIQNAVQTTDFYKKCATPFLSQNLQILIQHRLYYRKCMPPTKQTNKIIVFSS